MHLSRGGNQCTLTGGTLTVRAASFTPDLLPVVYDADLVGACGPIPVAAAIRRHASTGYAAASVSTSLLRLVTPLGTPATEHVDVVNTGSVPLPVGAPIVRASAGFPAPPDLSASSTCPDQLPVGGSCRAEVSLGATAPGGRNSTLVLPVGTLAGERHVALSTWTVPRPDAPTQLTATPVLHRNWLTWREPISLDTGLLSFSVYRSVDGAPATRVAQLEGLEWADTDVRPGHRYLYAVTASSSAGEGPVSNGATVIGASESIVHVTGGTGPGGLYETPVNGGLRVPLEVNGLDHAYPSVSPDGLSVAYARESVSRGQYDLFVRRLDTGEVRRLTATAGADELDPAWSPDGRTIALTRFDLATETLAVQVLPAVGGPARTVRGDVADPAWLPDGRTLVASSISQERLVRLSLTGAVAALPGGAGGYAPAVSPNGDTLVFTLDDGLTNRLARMPLAGGTPVLLASTADFYEPTWSTDGRSVIAEVESGTALPGLARVPLSGTGWGAPVQLTYGSPDQDQLDLEPTLGGGRVWLGQPALRLGTATVPVHAPAGTSATCSLDGATYTACGATWTRSGLGHGPHVLRVRAAGTGRPTSVAAVQLDVDRVAPVAGVAALPPVTMTPRRVVTWSAADAGGVATYDARVRRFDRAGRAGVASSPAGWTATTATGRELVLSPGYASCVSVRARDAQGNTSPWSAERCTASPVDDRALAAAGGFTRTSSPAGHLGTLSSAARAGASLSLPGVRTRRVLLVASTCPSCGSVTATLGGTRLGTVVLSRATADRVVLALPVPSTARAGTLVLRTTGAARVQVDAVALLPG